MSTRQQPPEPIDTCLAFYGIDGGTEGGEGFFDLVVGWWSKMGQPPTHLSVCGRGHSGRTCLFHNASKKLRATGFGTVDFFNFAVCPPGMTFFLSQADLYCVWTRGDFAALSLDSRFVTFDDERLFDVLRSCVASLKPEYGVGGYLGRWHGSIIFADGLGFDTGEPITEEQLHKMQWGSEGKIDRSWREGILRDVFRWNLLTKPQLAAQVGKSTLRAWILGGPGRGRLRELDERTWLWDLSDEEIEHVRPALAEAKLLF
jgi:hypothetical protein